jgi:hypothetical protein
MAKHKKAKRYEEGGDVDNESYLRDTEQRNVTDEAPQKMEAAPVKKKAPIVTKEQLAKSGLSLRDYMNKQQGLDRRQPANWKKNGFYGSETGGDAAVMYRKSMAKGGVAKSSASSRADGCCERGHTKGHMR